VYELRGIYASSIAYSIGNLGVACDVASSWDDFLAALGKERYSHIFVASFLFEEARQAMRERDVGATPVLLAEFGEVIVSKNARAASMPVHAMSIANILNDVEGTSRYSENIGAGVRFVVPDARALVVDDISTNLIVAEGLLSPYKIKVDVCTGGEKAIELAKKNRYDIIFMDHMMPEMGGVEATAAIRALGGAEGAECPEGAGGADGSGGSGGTDEAEGAESAESAGEAEGSGGYFGRVPIVALTANAVSGIRELLLGNGFSDYMAKPIDVKKLDEILWKWIPKEKRRPPDSAGSPRPDESQRRGGECLAIEGVDVKRGIAMVGGTEAQYRQVLAAFCKDSAARMDILDSVPGEAGARLFTTSVHALKSAAASIGAAELSAEAARLEDAGLREDYEAIREGLGHFRDSLVSLTARIRDALSGEAAAKAENVAGRADRGGETVGEAGVAGGAWDGVRHGQNTGGAGLADSGLLFRLKAALNKEDVGTVDSILEKLIEDSGGYEAESVLAAISDHVLVSDFGKAAETLAAFMRR
jgi:CheY-like chemotaxis protein